MNENNTAPKERVYDRREMVAVDVSDLLGPKVHENENFAFCMDCADFPNSGAWSFIFPLKGDTEQFADGVAQEMRDGGCTEEFVNAYLGAQVTGAEFVMLYALP